MNGNDQTGSVNSGTRLRIGVFFIILFWLPAWLLAPTISDILGITDPTDRHYVLVIILLIQTVFGILGVIIASKQVVVILKKVPRKKVPKTIWHILWTGNTDDIG